MVSIDTFQTDQKIQHFIKKTLEETGFKKIVIGVSGGIDSAVACNLAARSISYENVIVALLPYGDLHKEDMRDAQVLIDMLTIPPENVVSIDIKPTVNQIIATTKETDHIRKGNIMARVRMIYLYDLSKKHKALVMGTENRTEYYLGYYTRFGDEASDIEPIKHLYKTQIRELAKFLKVPQRIQEKPPSANLWTDQTDEKEFGFSYDDADRILSHYFDDRMRAEEIIKMGIRQEIVERVLGWVHANAFKQHLPKVFY